MDSNVWIGLIGVCGTLAGAFFGAWLNPYMQEKKEIKIFYALFLECGRIWAKDIFKHNGTHARGAQA